MSYPPHSRRDFFSDFRKSLAKELASALAKEGISADPDGTLSKSNLLTNAHVVKGTPIVRYTGHQGEFREDLDLEFCHRYGYDTYSIQAINYIDGGYHNFPSLLPFRFVDDYSLGNFYLLVENGDYEIELSCDDGIAVAGYAFEISKRKRKSYLAVCGLRFNRRRIPSFSIERHNRCSCNATQLDEVRVELRHYPILYICRDCGRLYTCSCFANHLGESPSVLHSIRRFDSECEVARSIPDFGRIGIRPNICHLCVGGIPQHVYGSDMYYSSFLQRYLPYHSLFALRSGKNSLPGNDEFKEVENELRERFGYPKIGEAWITETNLFKLVQSLFPHTTVKHHYRGKEFEGLELDIWLPEYRLGIEYQGEQHYLPIDHWGGDDGLKKRKANDRKKRALCKSLNYKLIEFTYREGISVDLILKKLGNYINS